MADSLLYARNNFNSLGSSLASIQQNAQDDANSNTQNMDFYNQTLAQIKAESGLEGTQALVFGGVEGIRQSTELYERFQRAAARVKELPSTLSDIASRTAGRLTGRAQQAKDLYDTAKSKLSGTLEDVQAHATSVANQAKGAFSDATLSLKDSANLDELKTNFSNFQSDLTGRLAKANDILDSNIKQYSDLADQAKSQIGEIQGKMDALRSSGTGELTGLAKDQFDALSAKLPDLQGQIDKAGSFITSAKETRDTYAKQVADQITQQGEKAKAQFADLSSQLTPEQLRSQLGLPAPAAAPAAPVAPAATAAPVAPAPAPAAPAPEAVPTIEPPSEIVPTATEGGGGFFSRIGDLFRTKTTSTLQPATNAQQQLLDLDPESGGFGRGFITSSNEQIARFASNPAAAVRAAVPAASTELDILPSRIPFSDDAAATASRLAANFPRGALESGIITPDVTGAGVRVLPTIPAEASSLLDTAGSIGGRVLGAAGEAAGVFGGVQAGMDIARGQFNANDAANAFFGVQAGKSLGESAISGVKSAAASLGEQFSGAGAAAGNMLNAAQETGSRVITSLSESAARGTQAAQGALSATQDLVSGAAKTASDVGSAALDIGKAAVSDVSEGIAEASLAVLPVVGEVAGIGLAAYQIYDGFRDLFTHPSASAPTPIAVPTVANISSGFQSGI
jgi:hypothetical protein